jgi:hypothetical protein
MNGWVQKIKDTWRKFREMPFEEKQALGIKALSVPAACGVLWAMASFYALPVSRDKELPSTTVRPASFREDNGFLGEEIDRKAFVERLEKQYYAVLDQHDELNGRIDDVHKQAEETARRQSQLAAAMNGVQAQLAEMKKISALGLSTGEREAPLDKERVDASRYRLDVINVKSQESAGHYDAYLPAGSFVRATLLTGVYAPSEVSSPLPVLLRLDEAFFGPNETRIPLAGALAIGKATGDLTSERALIQITSLSAVNPSGEPFTAQGNIGYVTDNYGQLGVKGAVVRNTGKALALSFMAGFTGGAAEAMADAETTSVVSESGAVRSNLTGSRARNAAFNGLSQSALRLAGYYQDKAEKIIPAVRVAAGAEVYLVVLEGVKVYGLKKNDPDRGRYFD